MWRRLRRGRWWRSWQVGALAALLIALGAGTSVTDAARPTLVVDGTGADGESQGATTGTASPAPSASSTGPATTPTVSTPAAATASTTATTTEGATASTATTTPSASMAASTPSGSTAPASSRATAAGSAYRVPGWIARENARPGTADWKIGADERYGWIDGYLDTTSAQIGDTVTLFADTDSATWQVSAFRMGWYGGKQARFVWSSDVQLGRARQAKPVIDSATGLAEARWKPSLKIAIDDTWPPGDYLLKLTTDLNGAHYVPLTVRDDTSSADLAIVNAVTTWQAYNPWGSCSSYACPLLDGARRGEIVSFDRPYSHTYNKGSADFLDHELPLVSLVEREGLDVTYVTDIDLHERPALLQAHHGVVLLGHDEYYSTSMRRALETARDNGVNLAFLGANAVYRHIRLEPSWDGRLDRHLVNYRSMRGDAVAAKNPKEATVEWRTAPLAEPEASLIGIQYQCANMEGDLRLVNTRSWIFDGLSVTNGAVFPSLVGNEFDGATAGRQTPDDLEVLAHSPVTCAGSKRFHDMTYYSAPSGGGVFATGTIWWICALDATCSIAANGPFVRGVTVNVLRVFANGPAGWVHPSRGNLDEVLRGTTKSKT